MCFAWNQGQGQKQEKKKLKKLKVKCQEQLDPPQPPEQSVKTPSDCCDRTEQQLQEGQTRGRRTSGPEGPAIHSPFCQSINQPISQLVMVHRLHPVLKPRPSSRTTSCLAAPTAGGFSPADSPRRRRRNKDASFVFYFFFFFTSQLVRRWASLAHRAGRRGRSRESPPPG